MNKSTLLTILLISAICLLADAVSGSWIANMGTLASVVLSILFAANVRRQFGSEADEARVSCLVNAIVSGAGLLSGHSLGLFSFPHGLLGFVPGLIHALQFFVNVGFGIWQTVAWNKLRNSSRAAAASA